MPARPPITLTTPIEYAKGVGPVRAEQFAGLGVKTCGDLLHYLPRDYLHFTDEAPVAAMKVGEVATVKGVILQTRMHGRGRGGWGARGGKARLEALLEDASGTQGGRCVLTWFNPYGMQEKLLPGTMVRVTGKVTVFQNRNQIVQGKVEYLDGVGAEGVKPKGAHVEPVYPATGELVSGAIWKVVKGVVEELAGQVEEWFTPAWLGERKLLTRQEAMRRIHVPGSVGEAILAKRTLAYHEFFLHQTAFAIKRYHQRHGVPAVPLRTDAAVDGRIRGLLPFALTGAQNRVIEALRKDLAGTKPMNRLLQGDVGSGKTVVALYAMLAACATARGIQHEDTKSTKAHEEEIENSELKIEKESKQETHRSSLITHHFAGHQAALMAPTEILAEQHFITLSKLLAGKKVKIVLLTGSVTGAERREVLRQIAEGTVGIVVGTHALLSEGVRFKSLAAIVIDEQHKFGVEQRSRIRTRPSESGVVPHMLVMTATPIPRTLAMTAFGDLDVSVIDELPPGRQPIFTRMTPATGREEVYGWVAKQVGKGEQAYVVVPAIDVDVAMEEELELAEDAEISPRLAGGNGAAVGGGPSGGDMLSGHSDRAPESEGSARAAEHGTRDISLPSIENRKLRIENMRTAVAQQRELQADWLKGVRVGMIHGRMARETRQHIMERFREHLIDVLVATTVIEVGVDVPNATMMVVENADRFGLSQLHQLRGRVGHGSKQSYCVLLGDLTGEMGIARLQAMVKHTSGFQIAEVDLKLRGMGQLIGTAQSGRTDMHFAELLFDPVLLPLSRRDAFEVVAADPRLLDRGHEKLRGAVLGRFADSITLADVG